VAQAPALMQFLIVVLAAWLARQQGAFIEYLKAPSGSYAQSKTSA
jgi:hypothetical protein